MSNLNGDGAIRALEKDIAGRKHGLNSMNTDEETEGRRKKRIASYYDIIKLMVVDFKVSPWVRNSEGMTALHTAMEVLTLQFCAKHPPSASHDGDMGVIQLLASSALATLVESSDVEPSNANPSSAFANAQDVAGRTAIHTMLDAIACKLEGTTALVGHDEDGGWDEEDDDLKCDVLTAQFSQPFFSFCTEAISHLIQSCGADVNIFAAERRRLPPSNTEIYPSRMCWSTFTLKSSKPCAQSLTNVQSRIALCLFKPRHLCRRKGNILRLNNIQNSSIIFRLAETFRSPIKESGNTLLHFATRCKGISVTLIHFLQVVVNLGRCDDGLQPRFGTFVDLLNAQNEKGETALFALAEWDANERTANKDALETFELLCSVAIRESQRRRSC